VNQNCEEAEQCDYIELLIYKLVPTFYRFLLDLVQFT
jgi:hypothetical protein